MDKQKEIVIILKDLQEKIDFLFNRVSGNYISQPIYKNSERRFN